MNCLYITLFFNIVAGTVQIFIKFSNQLLYPLVIDVCHLPFAHNILYPHFSVTASWTVVLETSGMMWCNSLFVTRRFARISPSISWRSSMRSKMFIMNISPSFREFTAPLHHILPIHNITINSNNLSVNFHWAITFCIEKSYDAPCIWRDFGSALPFHTHLT